MNDIVRVAHLLINNDAAIEHVQNPTFKTMVTEFAVLRNGLLNEQICKSVSEREIGGECSTILFAESAVCKQLTKKWL